MGRGVVFEAHDDLAIVHIDSSRLDLSTSPNRREVDLTLLFVLCIVQAQDAVVAGSDVPTVLGTAHDTKDALSNPQDTSACCGTYYPASIEPHLAGFEETLDGGAFKRVHVPTLGANHPVIYSNDSGTSQIRHNPNNVNADRVPLLRKATEWKAFCVMLVLDMVVTFFPLQVLMQWIVNARPWPSAQVLTAPSCPWRLGW